MTYRCACAPKAELVTWGCQFVCTRCQHRAGMHHYCRGQCLEDECQCHGVRGVEHPGPWTRDYDRDNEIMTRLSQGQSMSAIGRALNLSPERVRQLVARCRKEAQEAG